MLKIDHRVSLQTWVAVAIALGLSTSSAIAAPDTPSGSTKAPSVVKQQTTGAGLKMEPTPKDVALLGDISLTIPPPYIAGQAIEMVLVGFPGAACAIEIVSKGMSSNVALVRDFTIDNSLVKNGVFYLKFKQILSKAELYTLKANGIAKNGLPACKGLSKELQITIKAAAK